MLLSAVLYAPGTALYFWARREQDKPVFTPSDWVIFIARGHRRRRRHLRAGDRLHHHLDNGALSWHRHLQVIRDLRRPLRGRPAAQGHGLRAGPGAPAPDAHQLRRAAVRRRHVGRQRQARPLRLHAEDARPRRRRGRDAQPARRDGGDPRSQEVDPRQPGRAEPGRASGLVDEISSYLDGLRPASSRKP